MPGFAYKGQSPEADLQEGKIGRLRHTSVGRGTACKAYLQRRSAQPQAARLLQQGQALLQLSIAEPRKALVSSGLPAAQVHSAILYAIAGVISACSTLRSLHVVSSHKSHPNEASRTLRAISCRIRT